MLVEALVGLAATSGWVIGAPPPGQQVRYAREYPGGEQETGYGPASLTDVDDASLELHVEPPVAIQPDTTVHGLPADFIELTDDGSVYGRGVRWTEAGVTLTVERSGTVSDGFLRTVAESVVAVSPERWEALKIATSSAPSRPPAGSLAVRLRSGRVGGRRWSLTVLLPPGFPVAPEDLRSACVRVRASGASSTECDHLAAWRRVGGTVFVYGTVPPRVKRVRVNGVPQRVRFVQEYPLTGFYAVPLPSRTCEVRIVDPDRRVLVDNTGPAAGGPEADRRRCLNGHPPEDAPPGRRRTS